MDYLIRFIQSHSSFRKPETDALADLLGLDLTWLFYSEDSPFAIVRFPNAPNPQTAAANLISRSILSTSIHELWGSGPDYATLHSDVHARTQHLWPQHRPRTFRFTIDAYQGSHTPASQRAIIESFAYTAFVGAIRMVDPENQFTVFEEYALNAKTPKQIRLGRLVASSPRRKALASYTLKKRAYIATTTMDAELSLVTANLALAAAGKLAYDPFMGTGSFPLACAYFGAGVFGSDLDGRSIRGKNPRCSVKGNFLQYGTSSSYLGAFVADLTNTPLRTGRFLDAILCDPPYGVREGLKVLGSSRAALQEVVMLADGTPAHLSDSYVPPKRAYSFARMLGDILDFGADMLVDGGRLCMWMPVAGWTTEEEEDDEEKGQEEEEEVLEIPRHPALALVSECTQHFNKWSRRLLTYRRLPDREVDPDSLLAYTAARMALSNETATAHGGGGTTADDLNAFRRKYFRGFRDPSLPRQHENLPHTY